MASVDVQGYAEIRAVELQVPSSMYEDGSILRGSGVTASSLRQPRSTVKASNMEMDLRTIYQIMTFLYVIKKKDSKRLNLKKRNKKKTNYFDAIKIQVDHL